MCFNQDDTISLNVKLRKLLDKLMYLSSSCGPVKGPEERHKLGITWNKYIEWKYKYSIGKRVLNVSLTAKVLG